MKITHKFISNLEYALEKSKLQTETEESIKIKYCPEQAGLEPYCRCDELGILYCIENREKYWYQPAKKNGKYILRRCKK